MFSHNPTKWIKKENCIKYPAGLKFLFPIGKIPNQVLDDIKNYPVILIFFTKRTKIFVILNWLQNPLRQCWNVILCPYLVFQCLTSLEFTFLAGKMLKYSSSTSLPPIVGNKRNCKSALQFVLFWICKVKCLY